MGIESLLELRWKYGGPREVWLRNADLIRQIVDKGQLKPLTQNQVHAPTFTLRIGETAAAAPPEMLAHRIPFPGGLKIPHLHLDDGVFQVNAEQWRAFSARIVEDLRARLEGAKGISFDQAMALGEAAESLG